MKYQHLSLGLLTLAGVSAFEAAVFRSNCQQYTVISNDTCIGICSHNNITYAQLLSWNPGIDPGCSVVPSPTLNQTTSRCAQYYLISDGDDCSLLATKFGITLKDFIFLNSEVWSNCANLELGYYYCVQPVGYISTYPGYEPRATAPLFNQTPTTSLPKIGNPLANWPVNDSIIPIANNTRKDCYDYIYMNNTNTTVNLAADCWNLAWAYGITREELVLWNPSLEKDDTSFSTPAPEESSCIQVATPTTVSSGSSVSVDRYTYPCTLAANTSYCVLLLSPTPAASVSCAKILKMFRLTIDQFQFMNPSVNQDCSTLVVGTHYCVTTERGGAPLGYYDDDDNNETYTTTIGGTTSSGTGIVTPSPVQTGMTSACDNFYKVQIADGCSDIAQNYSISLGNFHAWNPAIKADCSGLHASVYVCVGVLTSTRTTSVLTTLPISVTTPTPIQSGMARNCKKFHSVHAGDECAAIASSESIPLASFYAWNQAIKTNCGGLQAGVYVCVGVQTSLHSLTSTTVPTPTEILTPRPT
ncbi:LysM domain-containing protein [Trichoderma harzianum]|uniref:LysM domain-containing protein n=1 Tax=Trichoderma harzianum TaxID=5544 RepID=A0A0G0AAZ5_TRIHA|nr:LysM domain-containing protein [Trichoderma harzianum]